MHPSDQYQLISAQVHHTSSPSGIRAQDHPDPYFSGKIRISSWNRPQFSLGRSGFVTVSKRMQGNNTATQQSRKTLSILRLEAGVTHLSAFSCVQGVQEQQAVRQCKQRSEQGEKAFLCTKAGLAGGGHCGSTPPVLGLLWKRALLLLE